MQPFVRFFSKYFVVFFNLKTLNIALDAVSTAAASNYLRWLSCVPSVNLPHKTKRLSKLLTGGAYQFHEAADSVSSVNAWLWFGKTSPLVRALPWVKVLRLLPFPVGRSSINAVHAYTGFTQLEMTRIRFDTAHFLRFASLFDYRTLSCTPTSLPDTA